jgi:hypothetical protein
MPLCETHFDTKYISHCPTYNDRILNLPDSSSNELLPTSNFEKEMEGP